MRRALLLSPGVLLVSAAVWATAPRYTVSGPASEIVVRDVVTGLEWQQNADSPGGETWQAALAHCENLTYSALDSWRLPSVIEMSSIVDEKQPANQPSINSTYFSGFVEGTGYWTSTTYAKSPSSAYFVAFDGQATIGRGGVGKRNKIQTAMVLCVRGAD